MLLWLRSHHSLVVQEEACIESWVQPSQGKFSVSASVGIGWYNKLQLPCFFLEKLYLLLVPHPLAEAQSMSLCLVFVLGKPWREQMLSPGWVCCSSQRKRVWRVMGSIQGWTEPWQKAEHAEIRCWICVVWLQRSWFSLGQFWKQKTWSLRGFLCASPSQGPWASWFCSVLGGRVGAAAAASIPASADTRERCEEKESATFNSYTAADCQRQPNLIRVELDLYLMRSETN